LLSIFQQKKHAKNACLNNKDETGRKPSSVVNGHLSWRIVTDTLQRLHEARRAAAYAPISILHRMGFTWPACRQTAGELLPRLSTISALACAHLRVLAQCSARFASYLAPLASGRLCRPSDKSPQATSAHTYACLPNVPLASQAILLLSLQVGFADPPTSLHSLRTLKCTQANAEVYFCCTFPEVAFAGCYPAPCPVVLGLSSHAFTCAAVCPAHPL